MTSAGFEAMASGCVSTCTHTLGAGQFFKVILTRERNETETKNDDVNCRIQI